MSGNTSDTFNLDSGQYQRVIYLIKTGEKEDPKWVIALGKLFNRIDLKVIPCSFDQFKQLTAHQPCVFALIITTTFSSKRAFDQLFKRSLSFILKQKKLHLFHLSSFQRMPLLSAHGVEKNFYHLFPLPNQLDSLLQQVAFHFFNELKKLNTWPGGTSPKINGKFNIWYNQNPKER